MSTSARQAILDVVGRATAGEHPAPAGPAGPSEVKWLHGPEAWDTARASLEALGDRLLPLASREELGKMLADLAAEHQVTSAVRWDHPLMAKLDIDGLLTRAGVTCAPLTGPEDLRGVAAEAQLGITGVDALVATTGTIAMRCGRGMERAVSLLPEVHLALVERGRLVERIADLAGVLAELRDGPNGLPSAMTMVTGHSRTADIELVLVSGVHGPKYVVVAALDFDLV